MVTEIVGPEGAREDVSSTSDRDLVIRVINELLYMRHDLGAIMRELGQLTTRVKQLEDATPSSTRREVSRHDWSEELARLSSDLTARVKDPRDKMDSDRARAIASEVVEAARTKEKAVAYDKRDAEIRRLRYWAITFAIGTIVTFLIGHTLH